MIRSKIWPKMIRPCTWALIGRIGAAVPARVRTTFLELLISAAATKGGHVTDAILAIGLPRAWTTYYYPNLEKLATSNMLT